MHLDRVERRRIRILVVAAVLWIHPISYIGKVGNFTGQVSYFFLTAFPGICKVTGTIAVATPTHTAEKGEGMSYFRSCVVLASVLFAGGAALAQTTSGSMSGTVVDASDQVVPGADVIITNEQTGEQRRTVTNEVGLFAFPALQPGSYTIRAELAGFRPMEIKANMVLANNRLAVPPLRLEVGSLAEAVTVSAVGEVVATTQTSHQAILDLKQVENLSIRGRDPISLLKILPGVALLNNDQETFGGSFSTPVPNIQGGRGQTIYVDGINGGDGGGGGNFSAATNMDAIAEVNVQMSAYTAEYGLEGRRAGQHHHQARRRRVSRVRLLVQAPRHVERHQLLQQPRGPSETEVSLFEPRRHARRPHSEDSENSRLATSCSSSTRSTTRS